MMTTTGPTPTAPEGGWKVATSTADKMDLSSIPSSDVYLGLLEYKVKPGKVMDFAKGIDATQGQFYRHQPGCIAYVFGISSVDKDTVLGTAIWSSKELFYSLPKNPKDLEKLNDARAPYKALVEDMRIAETNVVFGVGHNKHPEPPAGEEQGPNFKWDEVMGTYGRRNVVPNIPESNVYVVRVEMKAQPGKGEEVAKGLEATQGSFYRTQPGCHAYQFGLSAEDEEKVIAIAIWSSKELFDSLPSNEKDLARLNEARAPYTALLEKDGIRSRDTTCTFGTSFYEDHMENYSHGVSLSQ